MNSQIKQESDGSITISVNVKLTGSFLEMEENIQKVVNQAGLQATLSALESFDTDGSAIDISSKRLTSKGKQKKTFIHPMD